MHLDRYSSTQPSTKATTIASPGLSVATSHRQASPSLLGAASEPPATPNGGNLAPAARVLHQRPLGRLSAAPLAAESIPRAPRAPHMLPLAPPPAPTAGTRVERPFRRTRPAPGPLRPAGAARGSVRQRRCGATETCASAVNGAG